MPGIRRGAGADVSATCLDCGAAFVPAPALRKAFCCNDCCMRWNNRRLRRGAQLYDLYMAHRFDRPTAVRLRVLGMMNRLASIWRDEDRRERDGRASWPPPAAVAERAPHLLSSILQRGRA